MFNLKRACDNCPFRKQGGIVVRRVAEIANPDATFHCHKTVTYSDDSDEGRATSKSQYCAGKLSMLINADTWWVSNLLRIASRLGWNPDAMRGRDECFSDEREMARVHRESIVTTGDRATLPTAKKKAGQRSKR